MADPKIPNPEEAQLEKLRQEAAAKQAEAAEKDRLDKISQASKSEKKDALTSEVITITKGLKILEKHGKIGFQRNPLYKLGKSIAEKISPEKEADVQSKKPKMAYRPFTREQHLKHEERAERRKQADIIAANPKHVKRYAVEEAAGDFFSLVEKDIESTVKKDPKLKDDPTLQRTAAAADKAVKTVENINEAREKRAAAAEKRMQEAPTPTPASSVATPKATKTS